MSTERKLVFFYIYTFAVLGECFNAAVAAKWTYGTAQSSANDAIIIMLCCTSWKFSSHRKLLTFRFSFLNLITWVMRDALVQCVRVCVCVLFTISFSLCRPYLDKWMSQCCWILIWNIAMQKENVRIKSIVGAMTLVEMSFAFKSN